MADYKLPSLGGGIMGRYALQLGVPYQGGLTDRQTGWPHYCPALWGGSLWLLESQAFRGSAHLYHSHRSTQVSTLVLASCTGSNLNTHNLHMLYMCIYKLQCTSDL